MGHVAPTSQAIPVTAASARRDALADTQAHSSRSMGELQSFDAHNSPEGLFRRYCRGRLNNFLARQIMTVTGSALLALLAAPAYGLATLFIALLGEAAERQVLRHILKEASPGRRQRLLALLAAAVQALSLAACVLICWVLVPESEADFFAAVYLAAATMNAGLSRPHFSSASDLRFVIFGLTALVGLLIGFGVPGLHGPDGGGHFFLAASIGMLAYICATFIGFVQRANARRNRVERELLLEKLSLEHSQSALRLGEAEARRLALVAEHATDSVIITRPDGRIDWVNNGFTRTTGYRAQEVIGLRPNDFLNAPGTSPETIALLGAAVRDVRPVRTEVLNRTKSGADIWVDTSVIPILNPDGTLAMSIAVERDVTEAKRREADLTEARAEAEAAALAKTRFLATMSHEIRTPMNGVIGMAELLSETDLSDAQRDCVHRIVDSGQALLGIINDVLDYSKLQSGKPVIHAEPFDPAPCLSGAVGLLQVVAQQKGIALDLSVTGDSVPTLLGDAGRIRQILLNLIGNAVKFTDTGGVQVALHGRQEAGLWQLAFSVKDSGIGIAADQLDRIFESFTQADDRLTRSHGGTGLGLAISRLLAQEMGGDIEVTSTLGEGSCFSFRVALPAAEKARAGPEPRTTPVFTGQRILVAEDNRMNALILRRMLEREALTLDFAENGAVAVDLFCTHHPDLVLMDMSMPVMDGLAATREIRRIEAEQQLPRVPIIALTANAFAEDRAACLAAGLDDFISKPVSRRDLSDRIAAHFAA